MAGFAGVNIVHSAGFASMGAGGNSTEIAVFQFQWSSNGL